MTLRGSSPQESRVECLALDLDGTILPRAGNVVDGLLSLLSSIRRQGTRVILVTGRCYSDLEKLIDLSIFDAAVIENGAILCTEHSRVVLAPTEWESTRRRLVHQLNVGGCEEVIISMTRQREDEAKSYLDPSIKLELNKDSLMLMPSSVSKGSGLLAALSQLGLGNANTMCVGDGENDLDMFRVARLKVAVENAVPVLKQEADYVTRAEDGRGVMEAIVKFIQVEDRDVENRDAAS